MFHRRAAAAATALLAVGLLAGCDKPVPRVAAVAGDTFVESSASRWCFEPNQCREPSLSAPTVSVRPGASVAIEVPHEVRERGWYVRIVDRTGPHPSNIQKDRTYFRFAADFTTAPRLELQVVALPTGGATGQPSGVWGFTLVNADAS